MAYSQMLDTWKDSTAEALHNGLSVDAGDFEPETFEPETEDGRSSESAVVIIDKRALERECLARSLQEHNRSFNILIKSRSPKNQVLVIQANLDQIYHCYLLQPRSLMM